MKDSTELPLLMVMIGKLMLKGFPVSVCDTHPTWVGPITEVRESVSDGAFTVVVTNEHGKSEFNVMHPEKWKLGKDHAGEWSLWAPAPEPYSGT